MCFLQITIRYPRSFSHSSGVAEPESGNCSRRSIVSKIWSLTFNAVCASN